MVAAPGLNLNSLKSIRSFVNWMEGKAGTLDILINNTGASYMDKKPFDTEDGFAARAQVWRECSHAPALNSLTSP